MNDDSDFKKPHKIGHFKKTEVKDQDKRFRMDRAPGERKRSSGRNLLRDAESFMDSYDDED